jgi:hypothetical protein
LCLYNAVSVVVAFSTAHVADAAAVQPVQEVVPNHWFVGQCLLGC